MRRKVLSLLLAMCMVVAMFPTAALAVSDVSSITVNDTKTETTVIKYGGMDWYTIGYDGTGVVSDAGTMTLFAKDNIDSSQFKQNYSSDAYSGSDLKVAVEAIANGFTSAEQAAISERTLDGISGAGVSNAKLWPLSTAEANSVNKVLRVASEIWWLRSPGSNDKFAAAVVGGGWVLSSGHGLPHSFGVRPAFKLNLESVLFTFAAEGGKSGTTGAALSAVADPIGAQKLTIIDAYDVGTNTTGLALDTATTTSELTASSIITVYYAGATTGKALSAIVVNKSTGAVTHYGKLAENLASEDGMSQVTLPADFDNDAMTLKVFTETINDDNITDYASTPVAVTARISGSVTMPWGTEFMVNNKKEDDATVTDRTTVIKYNNKDWYVIGAEGTGVTSEIGTMTLHAKDNIENASFHDSSNAYLGSNLKVKVGAIENDFSLAEQAAISTRILAVGTYSATLPYCDGVATTPVNDAKLWPLSTAEANSVNMVLRVASDFWWLRSPGHNDNLAAFVDNNGDVDSVGMHVYTSHGIRPAFKLNLKSVLFTSAAEGGKSRTTGAALSAVADPIGAQKLTIIDAYDAGTNTTGLALDTATTTSELTASSTITVYYAGATTGKALSAIVVNKSTGAVTHYGKLAENLASEDGMAQVTLPADFDNATMTLKVFTETINENNLMDYTSEPVEFTITTSTIDPTTATFDKYTSAAGYADVAVTQTLNGNTLTAINNGETALTSNTDYTVSGSAITIKKEYLEKQAVGTTTLTFDYSVGTDPTLAITVSNSTPSGGNHYDYYTITVNQTDGGKISPTTRVRERLDKTFTITPDKGYVIKEVLVDGESVGAVKEYTFKHVTKGHTIKVVFEAKKHENPNTGAWDNPFTDVNENDWFYENVALVNELDLMNGTSSTTFAPRANTTRGMIVTVLYNMAGKTAVDTTDTVWYAKGRAWAMENGISDGTNLENNITREQLVVMIWRYAGSPVLMDYEGLTDFTDAGKISGYAQQAMAWAHQKGIIKGKGNNVLDPKGNATRAEVATMIINYLNSVEK